MKKLIIFLSLSFITFSFGQTYNRIRKVVPLLVPQNFYLNGATKGSFGGNSRTSLLISLPKNTVEWYYVISTTPNQSNNVNLNLVSQLTRLIDHTGMTSIAAASILAPSGNGGACDVFLMDRNNKENFIRKVDLNGGNFFYTPQGSRENFQNGVVQIKSVSSGDWYLVFRNRSFSSGISINIEAAAIVEEVVFDNTTWSAQKKSDLFDKFYSVLKSKNMSNDVSKEIAGCIIDKLITQKTPEVWDNLNEDSRQNYLNQLFSNCSEKYQSKKSPEQEKGMTYGNLGWKAFENGELDKAIEYSKKSILYDNNLGFVKANLGLFMLIKGDEATATDYYIDAISDIKRDKMTAKRYLEAVIDDINQAIRKYSNIKGYNSILDLYRDELKRF